ncbi:MAG: hypothetical protein R2725_12920 [Solirubrobacterales bacterium]
MRNVSATRPSPALAISVIALFVALGGSAYAATQIGTKDIRNNAVTAAKIKKSSVTTAKIKANAVTAAKLRSNAVTTAKIKANAVTGAKVDESTLGQVPSAASATTAQSADSATNAANATNWSRYFHSGLVKASVGQTVDLATVGPFSMVGKCTDEGAGIYKAAAYMTTTQAGSNLFALEGDYYDENDFEPGEEAQFGAYTYTAGVQNRFLGSSETSFAATSGDGSTLLEGHVNTAVRSFGADCAFSVAGVDNG